MQYISEALVHKDTRIEYNYSDMFSMFKKKIEETNESCVEYSQLVSFCMEIMTYDYVSLEDLEEMSEESLIEAIDVLEEVREVLNSSNTFNFKDIPLKDIPPHLHKFFTVEKAISFFDKLSSAKVVKNRTNKKRKSKLFF